MKIAILGGTGKTGRLILEQAMAEGHHVTALARDPSKLPPGNWKLTIQLGDVTNADVVDDAIFGSEAVIYAVGLTPDGAPDTLSTGMANVVEAMQANGVARVLAVAGAGILDAPGGGLRMDEPDFPEMLIPYATEHKRIWDILAAGDLQWTLICPTFMQPAAATANYRVALNQLPADAKPLAFADVAAFMLHELAAADYIGQRVGISE